MSGFLLNRVKKGEGFVRTPLEGGLYEAVLLGIVGLEIQKTEFEGKVSLKPRIRFLFEIPSEVREDKEGNARPIIQKYDVNVTANEKGKLLPVVSALLKKKITEEELQEMVNTSNALDGLLGKGCILGIDQYTTSHGVNNSVKSIHPLKSADVGASLCREPFSFSVANPDLDVFANKLSKWTRRDIMSATNAEHFPQELHKKYLELQQTELAQGKDDNPLV